MVVKSNLTLTAIAITIIGIVGVAFLLTGGHAQAKPGQHTITDGFLINQPAQVGVTEEFSQMTPDTVNLIPAAGTLLRTKDGISYTYQSADLEPGAYTLWLEIFNKPDACTLPIMASPSDPAVEIGAKCTGGPALDIADPKVKGAIVRGTSLIVGADRVGNFSGSLDKGTPPVLQLPFGTGNGIEKPMDAEVHLNVRYHGPALIGMTDYQIATPNGGCPPNDPNPFAAVTCFNAQVSYHVAP